MFRQYLSFQSLNPQLLFAAADTSSGSSGITGDMSSDDILDFLKKDDSDEKDEEVKANSDDDKDKDDDDDDSISDKKASKASKDKDDDDYRSDDDDDKDDDNKDEDDNEEDEDDGEEDLKAIEEDLEEPGEDKLELTTPTSRREILKKYPKLFKEFPYLETAYYREQEFTKLLPTIKDAKEAVDKSHTLDRFSHDLSDGNTEVILRSVKDNDPKAFNKIADNYLTTLSKVDKDAYHHVIGNTIRHIIQNMVKESRASQNEVLENAAVILNQFAFGSSQFTQPTRLSEDAKPEEDGKEKQIADRERAFVRQKFNSANTELTTRVNKTFKATIEANIDPRQTMTDYVKRTATRDALEELESLISKDTRFRTIVDKLWERAFANDFDSSSTSKIRSAFVSKAQTLLPAIIKKARSEAMRGNTNSRNSTKRRVRDENDDDSRPTKESKTGDESRRRNDSKLSRKGVPDGMSSLDYLMSD